MTQVHDTNFLTKCLPIQHRVHQDYLAANYCPTVEEGQQDFCVEKLARYYIGMLVSGYSLKSRICSTHNFFDRMPLSTTTLWMEQSTSVRLWVSVTLLGAEGEREFSCNCLEHFCPGTPARSASRAWSGLRPTSRIPSWSQSMLSTSSRTSAKVPPQSLLSSLHPATKFPAIRFLESSCQIFLFARRLGRLQGARYPGLPCHAQHGHGEVFHPHRDLVRHEFHRISALY